MNDVTIQNRYARQVVFEPIGPEGQQRLSQSRAVIVGCGALGSMAAQLLVRAGVGFLRIIDRDIVERINLQRQTLYTEADAEHAVAKATAAAAYLRRVNQDVTIEPVVAEVTEHNIDGFIADVDVILDGVDNFPARFAINDAAFRRRVPYIFTSCLAAEGMCMAILPPSPPCLRCLMEQPPAPGETQTAETAGILGPVATLLASFAAMEAVKLLTGNRQKLSPGLTTFNLWTNRIHTIALDSLKTGCSYCSATG